MLQTKSGGGDNLKKRRVQKGESLKHWVTNSVLLWASFVLVAESSSLALRSWDGDEGPSQLFKTGELQFCSYPRVELLAGCYIETWLTHRDVAYRNGLSRAGISSQFMTSSPLPIINWPIGE